MFKAVLWDFGGVISSSPFDAFREYELARGLPVGFIRSINATNHENNAWAQLESSRISREEFDRLFAEESRSQGHEIPGRDVLELLGGSIREEMVEALRRIRERFRIGCITNNMRRKEHAENKPSPAAQVMALFDVVIESSKVGIRKPNPEIYKIACREINVSPQEAIFLDDLGVNLKPARQLGMTTIKVVEPDQALAELESHLDMVLR